MVWGRRDSTIGHLTQWGCIFFWFLQTYIFAFLPNCGIKLGKYENMNYNMIIGWYGKGSVQRIMVCCCIECYAMVWDVIWMVENVWGWFGNINLGCSFFVCEYMGQNLVRNTWCAFA